MSDDNCGRHRLPCAAMEQISNAFGSVSRTMRVIEKLEKVRAAMTPEQAEEADLAIKALLRFVTGARA